MKTNPFTSICQLIKILFWSQQETEAQQRKFPDQFKISDEAYHNYITKHCKFLYKEPLDTKKVKGGFTLGDSLTFIDSWGDKLIAPENTFTDGATLPSFLGLLPGDKYADDVFKAACIHDAYCQKENESRTPPHFKRPKGLVSQDFYEGLILLGMKPWRAKAYYAAVYIMGPEWQTSEDEKTEDPFRSFMPTTYVGLNHAYKQYSILKKDQTKKTKFLASEVSKYCFNDI